MNAAHWHLILNHVPVLGLFFGLALLAWGAVRRNEPVLKAGLVTLVIIAFMSIPTYLTGEPAEEIVEGLPEVSRAALGHHEEAALPAFIALLATGAACFGGLWLFQKKPAASWYNVLVLLLALVAAGLMVRTANLGGKIRHSEIRGGTVLIQEEDEH